MHNVDRSVNWDELWEAFEGLVRSGKVYYVGASKFAGWELMKAQEAARRRNFMGLACEQHRYDMLRRAAELEAFPCCIDQGIGVTLYSRCSAACSAMTFSSRTARSPMRQPPIWRNTAHN